MTVDCYYPGITGNRGTAQQHTGRGCPGINDIRQDIEVNSEDTCRCLDKGDYIVIRCYQPICIEVSFRIHDILINGCNDRISNHIQVCPTIRDNVFEAEGLAANGQEQLPDFVGCSTA